MSATVTTVCNRCSGEAEFQLDENIWRHKGNPSDARYFRQSFCDRYGYPIAVREVVPCAPCQGSGGSPNDLCSDCAGAGWIDAARKEAL